MLKEREQLIIDLRRISKNDFTLDKGEKASEYIDLMLKYIGDTDPELRDELIFTTFANLINEEEYVSGEEINELAKILLSEDCLFYKIGSDGDDSVFRRSFSALTLCPIIGIHSEEQCLEDETVKLLKESLIKFFDQELDSRSYDNEKGWMHTVAHGADAFHNLLCCKDISEGTCLEVLECIKRKLFQGRYFFDTNEDERLTSTVYYGAVEGNLIDQNDFIKWIKSLSEVLEIEEDMVKFRAKLNTKNFVRSLYFRLLLKDQNKEIIEALLEVEKALNNFAQD